MNKKDKAMARKLLKSIYMPDSEIENEIKNNTLSEIVQLVFYVRLGAAFLVGARYLIALDAKKEKQLTLLQMLFAFYRPKLSVLLINCSKRGQA